MSCMAVDLLMVSDQSQRFYFGSQTDTYIPFGAVLGSCSFMQIASSIRETSTAHANSIVQKRIIGASKPGCLHLSGLHDDSKVLELPHQQGPRTPAPAGL